VGIINSAFQVIFDRKIYDHCQLTGLRSHRVILATLNLYNIETDNSKPVERRGRKAMDLKLRALRNKTARLPKSIPHYFYFQCLVPRPGIFISIAYRYQMKFAHPDMGVIFIKQGSSKADARQ